MLGCRSGLLTAVHLADRRRWANPSSKSGLTLTGVFCQSSRAHMPLHMRSVRVSPSHAQRVCVPIVLNKLEPSYLASPVNPAASLKLHRTFSIIRLPTLTAALYRQRGCALTQHVGLRTPMC